MKQCNNCGTWIDDDAQFCTSCGTPYSQSAYQPQPEYQEEDNYQKWYYIGGAATVILLLVIGGGFLLSRQGGNPISEVVSAIDSTEVTAETIEEDDPGCDTEEEYPDGYKEELTDFIFKYYQNGVWGLKNINDKILVSPRYANMFKDKNIIVGQYEDGKLDIIDGGKITFDAPLDSYEFTERNFLQVKYNGETWLYFPPSGYKLGPVKVWKMVDYKVMCRIDDGPLCFCNDEGTVRDNFEKPIHIINETQDEEFIVNNSETDSYTFYTKMASSQYRIDFSRWTTLVSEYLQRVDTSDPYFDATYKYEQKLTDLLNATRN